MTIITAIITDGIQFADDPIGKPSVERKKRVEGQRRGPIIRKEKKKMIRIRKFATTSATVALAILGASSVAFAEEATGYAAGGASGIIALSSALAIAISAFGAALGQGKAVAKAMESIGRNPNSADRIQTPMIIGLALMEALAIYGLIIAFILSGKF